MKNQSKERCEECCAMQTFIQVKGGYVCHECNWPLPKKLSKGWLKRALEQNHALRQKTFSSDEVITSMIKVGELVQEREEEGRILENDERKLKKILK